LENSASFNVGVSNEQYPGSMAVYRYMELDKFKFKYRESPPHGPQEEGWGYYLPHLSNIVDSGTDTGQTATTMNRSKVSIQQENTYSTSQ
jgi:hypothetical protein